MSLVEHAKRELSLLGNDEDFNASIIATVEAFASYGHSGGSASYAIPLLNDLLQFKNIMPLTDDPLEWNEVIKGTWQSCRNPKAFSDDGGKTYCLNSDLAVGPKIVYQSEPKKEDVEEKVAKEDVEEKVTSFLTENLSVNEWRTVDQQADLLHIQLRAWVIASKMVEELVSEHGLDEYKSSTGFITSSTFTPVDQHLDHIMNVANWLLERE